jgi:hypothetical protein
MSAIDAGIISAAAVPWTNRAATRAASVVAAPHPADAATNSARPAAKTWRAATRSDSGARPQEQRREQQRVGVDRHRSPVMPARKSERRREGDVHDHRVQGDDEEPEDGRRQRDRGVP